MNRDELGTALEHGPGYVVRQLFIHVRMHHEKIGSADDTDVSGKARVHAFRYESFYVESFPVFVSKVIDNVVIGEDAYRNTGRVGKISDRGCGQAAAPEEGIDLSVLQRVRGLRHSQALPRNVLLRINAIGLKDSECGNFSAAAWGPGADNLAFEILHRLDWTRSERDDVSVVFIERGTCANGQSGVLERARSVH